MWEEYEKVREEIKVTIFALNNKGTCPTTQKGSPRKEEELKDFLFRSIGEGPHNSKNATLANQRFKKLNLSMFDGSWILIKPKGTSSLSG